MVSLQKGQERYQDFSFELKLLNRNLLTSILPRFHKIPIALFPHLETLSQSAQDQIPHKVP